MDRKGKRGLSAVADAELDHIQPVQRAEDAPKIAINLAQCRRAALMHPTERCWLNRKDADGQGLRKARRSAFCEWQILSDACTFDLLSVEDLGFPSPRCALTSLHLHVAHDGRGEVLEKLRGWAGEL